MTFSPHPVWVARRLYKGSIVNAWLTNMVQKLSIDVVCCAAMRQPLTVPRPNCDIPATQDKTIEFWPYLPWKSLRLFSYSKQRNRVKRTGSDAPEA